ncbi:IS3 family transposase [Xanthomonas arboricola]
MLKQSELGMAVGEVCRKLGIAEATFYVWRKECGGLGQSELKRLRLLEEESRKLKQLVADLSLDKAMLQEVVTKRALRPPSGVCGWACCASVSGSAWDVRCKSCRCPSRAIRTRPMLGIAVRSACGCERLPRAAATTDASVFFVILRREGWRENHKRIHRIYKEEGLFLRCCRPRRSRSARRRQSIKVAAAPNTLWGMDFVSDALSDDRRFRLLSMLNHFTNECLAIVVDQSLRVSEVAEAVSHLVAKRGKTEAIKLDIGSEFAGKVMDRWACERRGAGLFPPCTPTDNAIVESFSGRLRQECLNEHGFLSLADAQSKIEAWRRFYNDERPTVHWNGEPLRNSPENTGPKRVCRRRKRPKSLPSYGPVIVDGSISTGL